MASCRSLRRILDSPGMIASCRFLTRSTTLQRFTNAAKPPGAFSNAPAPPRLPKEEQEIFEQLQRQSTGAFSSPPQVNQSPHSKLEPEASTPTSQISGAAGAPSEEQFNPNLRGVSLKPEFKGEKNPKTGEIGGPKNEPLRWGAGGDWSYGGRVTDF